MPDKIDNKAFAEMEYATADKTAVNLLGDKSRITKENVHDMLMAAGFTPGLGNVADAADALLYAAEGEWGAAGLSMAAIIPFIGQAVSAKRALKIAKESGEKMVTMYRGVDKWYPGKMVKDRKFIGGGKWHKGSKEFIPGATRNKEGMFTSTNKDMAEINFNVPGGQANELILEFEVPKSYVSKHSKKGWYPDDVLFEQGLPKEFLKKVHK